MLWYEESLPAETILSGLVCCDKIFPAGVAEPKELMNSYCNDKVPLQMGGKATTGKGMVNCVFTGGQG